jgi:hypothetical protein
MEPLTDQPLMEPLTEQPLMEPLTEQPLMEPLTAAEMSDTSSRDALEAEVMAFPVLYWLHSQIQVLNLALGVPHRPRNEDLVSRQTKSRRAATGRLKQTF